MLLRLLARHGRILLLLVILALLLITEGGRGETRESRLEEAVMRVAGPLLTASTAIGDLFGSLGDFLFGWRGLKEENRDLRAEVERLNRQLEEQREEARTFRRLAAILEFKRETGLPVAVASIIGRDATNLFQTILINKGAAEGVRRNMTVLTPEGVVGRTIKVYANTSRVLLLTDRSSGIDALVQRTRDQGVFQGLGQEGCEMKYLPRQASVAVGDVIVTSGMGGIFPKGLVLGRVTSVKRGGYLLQNVEARPTASLDRLEEVVVVLKEGHEEEGR